MFYIYDNRNGEAQGPLDRPEAMKLCGKLNDEFEKKLTKEQRKTLTHQRDRRPYTFGTKADFTAFGKVITKITKVAA